MKTILLFIVISVSCAFAKPQVMFVHGANMKADSWQKLRDQLSFETFAIDLPGRGLEAEHKNIDLTSSSRFLCDHLEKDAILVAHSQAGAVVNHALGICPNKKIQKIIYISAVVPLPGETAFQKLSRIDEEFYFKGIRFNEEAASMEIISKNVFLDAFAPDATPVERELIWSGSSNEPAKIGEEKLSFDLKLFKSVKKYYIKTTNDRIISPASQSRILENIVMERVYEVKAAHLPMVTATEGLSAILESLVK